MANRGRHKKSKQHLVIQILGSKIANRMMECQKEQRNTPNLDVFLRDPSATSIDGGFIWADTTEGWDHWNSQAEKLRNHSLYLKYQNDRSKGFY